MELSKISTCLDSSQANRWLLNAFGSSISKAGMKGRGGIFLQGKARDVSTSFIRAIADVDVLAAMRARLEQGRKQGKNFAARALFAVSKVTH
jgi:hypothetical protein